MGEPGRAAEPSSQPPAVSAGEPRTRGFLFCDLRGYTAFVEAHGDRAGAALLERYRSLVRAAVGRAAGAEIRTEGDSFYVVFPSASPAVSCGLDIVAAAAEATAEAPDRPISVGVGIHAGESVEQAEGYVGSAVNIAARVCAEARAGEVLVTDIVRGLVRTSLDVSFTARGSRRLKGIAEAIALYRVTSGAPTIARARGRAGRSTLAATVVATAVILVVGAAVLSRTWIEGGSASPSPATSVNDGLLGSSSSPGSPAASVASPGTASGTVAPSGQIAFIATQVVGADFSPRQQLYVADVGGGDWKRTTELTALPFAAAWAPDGRRLAYLADSKEPYPAAQPPLIVTVATAPAAEAWPWPEESTGLLGWQGREFYPYGLDWSSTGELVVSANSVDPPFISRIFIVAADGTAARVVTEPDVAVQPGSGGDEKAAVSPDGLTIAFLSDRAVWAAALDGSGRIQVTDGVVAWDDAPSWSPDGGRIVFTGQPEQDGPIEIWVVDAQGTNLRRLTDDNVTDRHPVWSPDGRWIAWTHHVSGQRQIWIMTPDGRDARPLIVGDAGEQLDLQDWAPHPS